MGVVEKTNPAEKAAVPGIVIVFTPPLSPPLPPFFSTYIYNIEYNLGQSQAFNHTCLLLMMTCNN